MSDDAGQNDVAAEDQLVLRAKVDAEAFAALYDLYYPRVLAYCIRRLGDRATAEDVTSEVFLKVAQHLSAFSGRCGTDFRRWLFRIATNAVHAQLRQTLSRQSLLEAAAREGLLRGAASPPDLVGHPSGTTCLR
jgi:RNA polymerase sigma-70 factor (ECF subfamily)